MWRGIAKNGELPNLQELILCEPRDMDYKYYILTPEDMDNDNEIDVFAEHASIPELARTAKVTAPTIADIIHMSLCLQTVHLDRLNLADSAIFRH